MEYDIKGNITKKGDMWSAFSYDDPTKPYAVTGVNANANTSVLQREQSVTYTSFERPAGITENNYEAIFTYDDSGDRKKMQIKQSGNVLYQRYYLGDRYESESGSTNKQKIYLGGDAYTVPAVFRATAPKFKKPLSCLVGGGLLNYLGMPPRSNSLKQGLKFWCGCPVLF